MRAIAGRRGWVLAAMFVLLAGCAGFSGANLVPGKSTAAEVRASMGEPSMIVQKPGETWWYYPRGYFARKTFVARIGPDGMLRGIEQRLDDAYIKKVQVGESTMNDVRELLGPPHSVTRFDRLQRIVWEYRLSEPPFLWLLEVQFSYDGVVREVMKLRDPEMDGWSGADGGKD
ncbi:MAG: hypothetical protein WCA09_07220 [Burkholderiales bacterium]